MRRSDRMVDDINDIMSIVESCQVCYLAIEDADAPYVVPMNYGYIFMDGNIVFYFHCAHDGKRNKLIGNGKNVGFAMSCEHKLLTAESPCNYSMEYDSVCGHGKMFFAENAEKAYALQSISRHYGYNNQHVFTAAECNSVAILRLDVHEIMGKRLRGF